MEAIAEREALVEPYKLLGSKLTELCHEPQVFFRIVLHAQNHVNELIEQQIKTGHARTTTEALAVRVKQLEGELAEFLIADPERNAMHTHDGEGREIAGGPVTTQQARELGIALFEDVI